MFNGLSQLAVGGELTWKSFGKVAIDTLFKIGESALEAEGTIGGALDSIFGSFSKGGGGLFGFFGDLFGGGGGGTGIAGSALSSGSSFGGFFADGGRPPVGLPSVVGEEGPEVWFPDRPGTIVSNDNLANLGGNHFNVDMRGASVEAVQRLESMVNNLDATLEHRAVGATMDAQRRGRL